MALPGPVWTLLLPQLFGSLLPSRAHATTISCSQGAGKELVCFGLFLIRGSVSSVVGVGAEQKEQIRCSSD